MSKIKKIIISAMLLSTALILSRFLSVKTPIITISFSFIPIMLCAIILGWKWTILVATLNDLIGALLFPFGAYFIGFTISAFIGGLIYGVLLYKFNKKYTTKQFIIRLIVAVSLVVIFVNGGLNTLWIYITTGSGANIIVPVRIAKQLVMLPIQVILIFFIDKHLPYEKLKEEDYEEEEVSSYIPSKTKDKTKATNKTANNGKNKETTIQSKENSTDNVNRANSGKGLDKNISAKGKESPSKGRKVNIK